ncbi:MAG: PAS domain S-box protein [Nitrospirae bacterium]|nr:PAS domain S-box protein [Nitrospirota bacterium]
MEHWKAFLARLSPVFFASRKAAIAISLLSIAVLALMYIAYREVGKTVQIELPTRQADTKHAKASTEPFKPSVEILILNSYHVGHAWSDNEIAGIIAMLQDSAPGVRYHVEYLDCKRHPKYEHFDLLKDLLKLKYGNRDIPVVMAADNPALKFAIEYRSQLFPRSAIVFCGVNNFRKEMLGGQENITGHAEVLDAVGTVRMALKLHPKTREIVVVHDYTSTGLATRQEAQEQMKGMFDGISFRNVEDLTKRELMRLLNGLHEDSLVLALTYSVFKDGEVIGHEDIAGLLAANSPVPVYGVHFERLGYGIVGGSLLGGKIHGEDAARLALKILSGTPASGIPVEMKPPTRMMFDHDRLARFGIPARALPKGSIIVNRPVPFIESHTYLVASALMMFIIMTSGIVILAFNVYRRRLAEDALRKSMDELEARVAERTSDLHDANKQLLFELTERKRAEDLFKQLSLRNEMILNSVGDGIYGTDINGNIVFMNKAAQDMLGCAIPDVLGKKSHDIFHHTKADGAPYPPEECPLHRSLAHGETYRGLNEVFWRSDGRMFPVEHVNTPLVDNAVVVGAVVVFRDITERKRAEAEIMALNEELENRVVERTVDLEKTGAELKDSQMALMNIVEDLNEKTMELEQANAKLKELDHLKSMFIASMSHELRTPLNSIIGFSSIMLNEWAGPVSGEQKENLSAILRSGRHLLSLINDVIDVSKIEAGMIDSSPEDFDVFDVVAEAMSTFTADVKDKELELKADAEHLTIHADRRRLLQCLLNFISNAVKFTLKGSVEVRAISSGGILEISVSDSGIGIRQEDIPKLFSPFVRLESPVSSKILGTGLGLYLTRKLATEVLKGEVSVESEYGKGSRFYLRVPVRQ